MSYFKTYLKAGLLSLALVAFGIALYIYQSPQHKLVNGYDDLSSLKNTSIERETELGTPEADAAGPKKEISIAEKLVDPDMSKKWDIDMTDAFKAWTRHGEIGSRDIKVCVIDTGIDVNHPDLANNLWINPGESCLNQKTGRHEICEKSRDGIDSDGNGFIDDVYGWNFVSNNNDLRDNHGHGTHISGIIGAEGGNGIGISGISPRVSIITAKYYDPQSPPQNNLANTIRAIRYCAQAGAHIINYSGGGTEPSDLERNAIADARDAQGRPILFIAAAGNERSNSDVRKYYPAGYGLPNIISVTAINREKKVLDSSNYGVNSVDLAAPGHNLYSTLPGGRYGTMTGTSQATAVVTGAAALIKSRHRDYAASEVIAAITETGDYDPTRLAGRTRSLKRLNIYRALSIVGDGVNVVGAVPRNVHNLRPDAYASTVLRPPTNSGIDLNGTLDQLNSFIESSEGPVRQRQQAR